MAKTKHSFIVSVEAESELGANVIAKAIRIALKGLKFWEDVPCGRNAIGVKKVTVTNRVSAERARIIPYQAAKVGG